MTDQPFNMTDFIVVLALSLIFIIPFALFIRGAVAVQNQVKEKKYDTH